MKILEIGTGSGYQAAVLAYLGCDVYTMEYVEELASQVQEAFAAWRESMVGNESAQGNYRPTGKFFSKWLPSAEVGTNRAANIGTITTRLGNGFDGWPEEAPFDAVIVTAAPQSVPPRLIDQLRDGGRMVVPVGWVHSVQELLLITKKDGGVTQEDLLPVRFVPMVGG
jgi:protein-L-isoaspartate(D-aspartate) O-methyltransferase